MKQVIEQILEKVGLSGIEAEVLPGATSSLVLRAKVLSASIPTRTGYSKDLVAHEVFALDMEEPLGTGQV